MAAIQTGRLAQAGFGSLFTRPDTALRTAWLPVGLATVAQALLFPLIPDLFDLPGVTFLKRHGLQTAVLVLVWLSAYGVLASRWLDIVLPSNRTSPAAERYPSMQSRYVLAALFLAGWLAVCIAVLVGSVYLAYMISTFGGIVAPLLVFLAISIVSMLIIARLMLLLPMIAMGEGVGLTAVWRLTRGMSWRLFVGFALALLLIAVMWVAAGVGARFLFDLFYVAGLGGVVVDRYLPLLVHNVVGAAAFLILIGAFAEAYRQLDGPGIGPAEDLLAVFDD